MNTLEAFGWNNYFLEQWQTLDLAGVLPARVVADFGTSFKVAMPELRSAELSGKLAHYANRQAAPKVGDWVALRATDHGQYTIEAVLSRRSEIARKVAGKRTLKQVIAANVDIAFVVLALDNDFSVERLQRFLYQLSVDNIKAVIVLNKADKAAGVAGYLDQLQTFDVPKLTVSALNGQGVDEIINSIPAGATAILLGSSGVGKSTLTNQLLGREAQATQATRSSDDTGKHTTVHRELFVLPHGGLLIDTPGIRELQLWGTQDTLDENFDDITRLASQCKYATCQHQGEQGCAIGAALENGALSPAHYANYQKMKKELTALKAKAVVQQKRNNRRPRNNKIR